jgi:hypothetical protein
MPIMERLRETEWDGVAEFFQVVHPLTWSAPKENTSNPPGRVRFDSPYFSSLPDVTLSMRWVKGGTY